MKTYDFAIVGSGVSGGRVAYELTKAGARCVLIEAGKAFNKNTFPDNEMDSSVQMFWNGGLEVSTDGHVGFLRAKCLGGTSVVNQALLDEFDDLAFDDWRARSSVSFFSMASFRPHYEAVKKEIPISEVPRKHFNKNTRIFIEAFEKGGYGWKPLERAQKDCRLDQGTDCIVCLSGCPIDSKQSSLVTTIAAAKNLGLTIESELEVRKIQAQPDMVKITATRKNQPIEVRAAKVVLAGGAIGNSAILLASGMGENLPALGSRFACHAQKMTYALFDEPVDAHKGAFQAVKSYDVNLRKMGLKFENVFAPPIGTAMLLSGIRAKHSEIIKKYRYLASMEVAIRDDAEGKIRLGKSGKVLIEKKLTREDRAKCKAGMDIVADMFRGVGAKQIFSCDQAFGLHLMGGCPIGTDAKTSVVDPEFRLHGFKNVFAADSSIFPSAPGINPSLTIMAMSHKASQMMIKGH